MRVLIITQYFWPESFIINDIALGLKERGYHVSVLTGKPNYPRGFYFKGYNMFNRSKEQWKGLDIYRVPLITRGKGGGARLFLNYISFAITSSCKVIFMKKKYDCVFVFQTSPVTVGVPAVILSKLFKIPFFCWVQDLWPASIKEASKVKNRFVLKFFNRVTKLIYNSASQVLVQSRAFIPYIMENQGIKKTKILYLPNTVKLFKTVVNHNKLSHFGIPKGFNIIFAGNIGNAQSFQTLLDSAKILKEKEKKINWIILGDGRMKQEVIKQVELLNLKNCFFLLGQFPFDEMSSFFSSADLLLMSLKKSDIFSLTIPSKLQSYMAFGKPIIASIDGEAAKIIKDAKAGFVSPAEDIQSLVKNILLALETDKEVLDGMGRNAQNYFKIEFSRKSVLDKIEAIFKNV